MPVTLGSEERDALFAQVEVDLGLLGDLQAAIGRGNEEECYRLGRRVSDALRLVVAGGLGWREMTRGATVLTLSDEEVRHTVTRMRGDVRAAIEHKRPEHEESQSEWDELAAIEKACGTTLDQISS
jgi:hypothetical protein